MASILPDRGGFNGWEQGKRFYVLANVQPELASPLHPAHASPGTTPGALILQQFFVDYHESWTLVTSVAPQFRQRYSSVSGMG